MQVNIMLKGKKAHANYAKGNEYKIIVHGIILSYVNHNKTKQTCNNNSLA